MQRRSPLALWVPRAQSKSVYQWGAATEGMPFCSIRILDEVRPRIFSALPVDRFYACIEGRWTLSGLAQLATAFSFRAWSNVGFLPRSCPTDEAAPHCTLPIWGSPNLRCGARASGSSCRLPLRHPSRALR